jgi:hypothetical protein
MALFFNTAGGAWDNSKKYKPARTLYLSIRLIHVLRLSCLKMQCGRNKKKKRKRYFFTFISC